MTILTASQSQSRLTDDVGDEEDAAGSRADDRPEDEIGDVLGRDGDNDTPDQLDDEGQEENRPPAVLVRQGTEDRRAEHHADHEDRVAHRAQPVAVAHQVPLRIQSIAMISFKKKKLSF